MRLEQGSWSIGVEHNPDTSGDFTRQLYQVLTFYHPERAPLEGDSPDT